MADFLKTKELPKFHTGMMLALGVIVGMLSYFLVFYAKADATPDIVPLYVSYGPAYFVASQSVGGSLQKNVWVIKLGDAVKFYTYQKNIGAGRMRDSGASHHIAACLNSIPSYAECMHYPSEPGGKLGIGKRLAYGSFPGTGGLEVGQSVFLTTGEWIPTQADLGTHTLTVCVYGATEVDSLYDVTGRAATANNCTSMEVIVVNAVAANAISSATVGTGSPDGYGTAGFNAVSSIYRHLCPGPPLFPVCVQGRVS